MELELKKFNPKTIDNNRVCVFIGKRGTGKSSLVADIMYHHRKIPMGVVMSGTEESNHFYGKMVPELFIYDDYNKDILEKIIKMQRRKIKKSQNPRDVKNSMFAILDDCMYDRTITKDECIRKIFMNGRHWQILLILTMQYCMSITPDLRTNIDYVFVLREPIVATRKKIWQNFFGIFPTFDLFCEVMDKCTEDYECMVIDNTVKSNRIEDCVFWYRAELHQPFKVGSAEFWKFHSKQFNPQYDNDSENDNEDIVQELKKKKKGVGNIHVHKAAGETSIVKKK